MERWGGGGKSRRGGGKSRRISSVPTFRKLLSVMDQAENADLLSLDSLQPLSSFYCIAGLGHFELGDFKQMSRAVKEDPAPPARFQ